MGLLLTLFSIALDILFGLLWGVRILPQLAFLLFHLFAMILLGWGLYQLPLPEDQWRHFRAALVYAYAMTLFIPLFGLAASIPLLVSVWFFKDRVASHIYDEYEEYIYSLAKQEPLLPEQVIAQIRGEAYFDPYIDILYRRGGDMRKPIVIEKLAHDPTPTGVALLRTALADPVVEVQQVAASGLGTIEDRLSEEIQIAISTIEQVGMATDYLHLGRLCRQYAKLGLLDKRMADHYLAQSAEAFQVAIDMNIHLKEAYTEYVDTLLELRLYDRASALIDLAEERGVESIELLFDRIAIDFSTGRVDRIVSRLLGVDLTLFSKEQQEVVRFWMSCQ